jgi:glucose/arabinose dehydrogenase
VRNPQRFGWDSRTGQMYMSDIGQNVVEEISPVRAGANLGWNVWEGSYRYAGRGGVEGPPRADRNVVYPVVEYAHGDPLLIGNAAVTGVIVYRSSAIPALANKVLFADFPSGEIFYFDADNPPQGGNTGFHRILLRQGGEEPQTALQLIRAKNSAQGKMPAGRADLRFGAGPNGQVLLINKADGTIRLMVPQGREE